MISSRYAWPAAALLLLAFVPTWFNVYRAPAPLEQGGLAAAIPADLEPFGTASEGRRGAEWSLEKFAATDFITRKYRLGEQELDLFAARTYDGKKLFHYPELALTYGFAASAERHDDLTVDGHALGARVLEFESPTSLRMSASLLFYGKRPVHNPISFMIRVLPELFVGKREPMTLIYVQGEASAADKDTLDRHIKELLVASSAAFLERP